jgi:hypothetical protein
MNKFLNIFFRRFEFQRSSHNDDNDQFTSIQAGDVVECAIETPDGLLYRVESINHATGEARVRLLADGGKADTNTIYTLAPVMLRPLKKAASR